MEYRYSHELEWGPQNDLYTDIMIDGVQVAELYVDNDSFDLRLIDPAVEAPGPNATWDEQDDYCETKFDREYECGDDYDLMKLLAFTRFYRNSPSESWQIDADFIKEKTGLAPQPYN